MSKLTKTIMIAKSLDCTKDNFDIIRDYLVSTLEELEQVKKELECANKTLDCNHNMFGPDEIDEYEEHMQMMEREYGEVKDN